MERLRLRRLAAQFALVLFSVMVVGTIAIYVCQGLNLGGFSLPEPLLRWLGVASLSQAMGLVALVYKALFRH